MSGDDGAGPMSLGETTFETARLRLEPLRASHAPELFPSLSDPRLYRFIPHEPPVSVEALAARFARLEGRRSPRGDEQWLNWVIRLAGGRCVGRVEATLRTDLSAGLAYEVDPAHWRQGIATEACGRIVQALFDDGGATEVLAEVDTRNLSSIALLERLGFERGALRKDADMFKGSTSDEWTYRLTRPAVDRAHRARPVPPRTV